MANTPAPDCLTALVGLSRGANACFPLPTDAAKAAAAQVSAAQVSAAGFYLDEVPGLRLAPAAGQTAATDLYDRLALARKVAAGEVRAALEAGRAKSYGVPLYQLRGVLGGAGNGQLLPAGTRALLTLATNYRREGALRINRLQLYTDQAVTDAPLLLDGAQVALLTTGAQGATAGLPAEGLLLPLDGNYHTLEVLLPEGVRLKGNNLYAGCFACSANSPWALSVKRNLQDVAATTPGYGFSLSVQEECTADPDFLCFATGSDYADGPARYPDIVRFAALAIQYKAAAVFITAIQASQQVGRYTMLEPKALGELRDYYESKLTTAGLDGTGNYLNWLNSPDGLGQVQHPCFSGAPASAPGKVWTL